MYEFAYKKALSTDDAVASLLADEDAKILAGGQTLLPTLKQRLAMPTALIDISKVDGLSGIQRDGNNIVVGAGTKHKDVATNSIVKESFPALAQLAGGIGDPHVRNRGTIGGSIANNDPSADYPSALIAANATVTTNKRSLSAADFFVGLFETALEPAEIILSVSFPIPDRAGYAKIPNPASRYALVGVFVAQSSEGLRVAVVGAGPCVFRVQEMESALSKDFSPSALNGIRIPHDDLSSDLHASAEYRAHLVTVAAQRAIANAVR